MPKGGHATGVSMPPGDNPDAHDCGRAGYVAGRTVRLRQYGKLTVKRCSSDRCRAASAKPTSAPPAALGLRRQRVDKGSYRKHARHTPVHRRGQWPERGGLHRPLRRCRGTLALGGARPRSVRVPSRTARRWSPRSPPRCAGAAGGRPARPAARPSRPGDRAAIGGGRPCRRVAARAGRRRARPAHARRVHPLRQPQQPLPRAVRVSVHLRGEGSATKEAILAAFENGGSPTPAATERAAGAGQRGAHPAVPARGPGGVVSARVPRTGGVRRAAHLPRRSRARRAGARRNLPPARRRGRRRRRPHRLARPRGTAAGPIPLVPVDDHGTRRCCCRDSSTPTRTIPSTACSPRPGRDLLDWLRPVHLSRGEPLRRAGACERRGRGVPGPPAPHGTTAAVVFSTVHRQATEILLAAAERRGMALVTGKTMMDRNAPDGAARRPGHRRTRQRGADRTLAPPRAPALRHHGALRGDLQRGPASCRRRACRSATPTATCTPTSPRASARSPRCGATFRGRATTPMSTTAAD